MSLRQQRVRAVLQRQIISGVELPADTEVLVIDDRISVAIVEVTPAMAQVWLDHAAPNRNLRGSNVEMIARAMTEKRFALTHQGLAFRASDGGLFDGRNRLTALVLADRPVLTMISWGWPDETMKYVDTGTTRSAADVAQIHGLQSSKTRYAIMRHLALLLHGSSGKYSGAELLTFAAWMKEPMEWVQTAFSQRNRMAVTSVIVPLLYVRPSNQKAIDVFTDRYLDREPAMSGDPAKRLRELILKSQTVGRRDQRRIALVGDPSRREMMGFVFSALRAHLDGETPSRFVATDCETAIRRWGKKFDAAMGPCPIDLSRNSAKQKKPAR